MTDPEITAFLDGVVGVVEATSCEKLFLWQEYHDDVTWEEGRSGFCQIVGHLAGMPVNLSLFTEVVDGHKLLFVDAVSQVDDHRMI